MYKRQFEGDASGCLILSSFSKEQFDSAIGYNSQCSSGLSEDRVYKIPKIIKTMEKQPRGTITVQSTREVCIFVDKIESFEDYCIETSSNTIECDETANEIAELINKSLPR